MPGKSKFQGAWLYNNEYKDVAAMGESVLKSHMKSATGCLFTAGGLCPGGPLMVKSWGFV